MLYKILIILLGFSPILGFTQNSDLECLTVNIFMEARGESEQGMRAVADTTINRKNHSAFKDQNTLCEVVFAKGQFSWTKTQTKKRTQKLLNNDLKGFKVEDVLAYQTASNIAQQALENSPRSKLPTWVISFHAVSINPVWSSRMKRYGTIGKHVFYGFKQNKGK